MNYWLDQPPFIHRFGYMQHVITSEQAKKITGGRTPLVPMKYEEAVKALQECRELDEAKYWDNKADALAAWAKIYRDDKAGREAAQTKLWAYRRMYELAKELRPVKYYGDKGGSSKGPNSLLVEHGLTQHQASAATRLGRASSEDFNRVISAKKVHAPTMAWVELPKERGPRSFSNHEQWRMVWKNMNLILSYCNKEKIDPRVLGSSVFKKDSEHVRRKIVAFQEWLDAFEQALPKSK